MNPGGAKVKNVKSVERFVSRLKAVRQEKENV
jgi:hypothetical protein